MMYVTYMNVLVFCLVYVSLNTCTTMSLPKVLTSCRTAFKNRWNRYCEQTYVVEGIHYFWSIKNSTEILNKLKAKGFK